MKDNSLRNKFTPAAIRALFVIVLGSTGSAGGAEWGRDRLPLEERGIEGDVEPEARAELLVVGAHRHLVRVAALEARDRELLAAGQTE